MKIDKANFITSSRDNKKPITQVIGFSGSPGRARTYNNSVNSRVLCHWATEEYWIRQRPNLPGRVQPSTFGTGELNFCVRYGNRWDPFVITTGNGNDFHTDRDPVVTRIRYALSDRSSLSSSDRRSYCITLSSVRQEGDPIRTCALTTAQHSRLSIQTDLFFCSQLISFVISR